MLQNIAERDMVFAKTQKKYSLSEKQIRSEQSMYRTILEKDDLVYC